MASIVKEDVFFDDDNLVVKRTINADTMLRDAEYARQVTPNDIGSDHKLVGTVDVALVHEWLKEAGVSWSDTHAVQEVIKKKLLDGTFSKLRVWEGNF